MSQQLLSNTFSSASIIQVSLSTKTLSHNFSVNVPDKWDYWEIEGKRVNFHIKRVENPEYPNFVGYSIILWLFNFYYVWRKLK